MAVRVINIRAKDKDRFDVVELVKWFHTQRETEEYANHHGKGADLRVYDSASKLLRNSLPAIKAQKTRRCANRAGLVASR